MRNYRDNDLNRILEQTDSLLADIRLYETPQEEQARKQAETMSAELQAAEAEPEEQTENVSAEMQAAEAEPEEQMENVSAEMQAAEAEPEEQTENVSAEMQVAETEPEEQTENVSAEMQVAETEPGEQTETPVEENVWKPREYKMSSQWDEFLAAGREETAEADTVKETECPVKTQVGTQLQEDTEEQPDEWMNKQSERPIGGRATTGDGMRTMLFSMLSFVFMEIVVQFGIYHSISSKLLYPMLFSAAAGCLAALAASLFSKRVNTILYTVFLLVFGCYGDLQIIYHGIQGEFLPLTSLWNGIVEIIQQKALLSASAGAYMSWIVVMFLPLILWVAVLRNWVSFEPERWYQRLILLFSSVILFVVGILTLDIYGYAEDAPYVSFYHFDSQTNLEEAGRDLGLTATTVLELLEQLH